MDEFQEIVDAVRSNSSKHRKRPKKKGLKLRETDKIKMDEKNREQIQVERKVKKMAKKQGKEKQPVKELEKNQQPFQEKQTEEVNPVKSSFKVNTAKRRLEDTALASGMRCENLAKPNEEEIPVKEKTREEVLRERELKKLAKQQSKGKKESSESTSQSSSLEPISSVASTITHLDSNLSFLSLKMSDLSIEESKATVDASVKTIQDVKTSEDVQSSKKTMSKAERRALQEAQRAAKTQAQAEKSKQAFAAKKNEAPQPSTTSKPSTKLTNVTKCAKSVTAKDNSALALHKVKLFKHLYAEKRDLNIPVNSKDIHPAIIQLGVQYANGVIVGGNARCVAFLNALKEVIQDYEAPVDKEFSRGLESCLSPCIDLLKECRPMSVSMVNALRYVKWQITLLDKNDTDSMKKEVIEEAIDTYVRDQIEKAAQAISEKVQEKITDGDVILTYGGSSLIKTIFEHARERCVNFRVVIVDSLPLREGQTMLKRLVSAGFRCTYVLINAVSFVMPEVTKVLLGAHALLANGYVTSRVGTAQIALIAKSFNKPVLVCCETHKFSERVQTDAFVYNEIGDPDELVMKKGNNENPGEPDPLANWENLPHLTPLNLKYDVTPPELVTAVVTENGVLPCSSVPVVLQIRPYEVAY